MFRATERECLRCKKVVHTFSVRKVFFCSTKCARMIDKKVCTHPTIAVDGITSKEYLKAMRVVRSMPDNDVDLLYEDARSKLMREL